MWAVWVPSCVLHWQSSLWRSQILSDQLLSLRRQIDSTSMVPMAQLCSTTSQGHLTSNRKRRTKVRLSRQIKDSNNQLRLMWTSWLKSTFWVRAIVWLGSLQHYCLSVFMTPTHCNSKSFYRSLSSNLKHFLQPESIQQNSSAYLAIS